MEEAHAFTTVKGRGLSRVHRIQVAWEKNAAGRRMEGPELKGGWIGIPKGNPLWGGFSRVL